MSNINVDKKKTAILFMDFQNFILDNFLEADAAARVVNNAHNILDAARKMGLLVIHVNVCFREGYPEINNRNKMFSWIRKSNMAMPNSENVRICESLKPQGSEPIIHKRRIGAFGGTDLDMILRAQGIENIILTGVATSNVVLFTFNQAFDLDYNIGVIGDACADGNSETHQFLIDKFFPTLGEVYSSEQFLAELS